ncbi:echinoderm microtubule-associated protein-like CG42247 [Aplysia californica]|uniref:Echinoderm microtubule-associated protein-like CG42247 n=1 Tax=Aplysia californica TaxID=6500 RepID=A0ABM1W342_APLCA|nr:echinoderm microtubule-associated protein-like CG42247 [Aplysia californica]
MDDKQLEELMVQSFIKIMMETEQSAEGKAELAQAQARDEQKRNSQVTLRLGQDGLQIRPDSDQPSQLPQQQQFQELQPDHQHQQQPQQLQQHHQNYGVNQDPNLSSFHKGYNTTPQEQVKANYPNGYDPTTLPPIVNTHYPSHHLSNHSNSNNNNNNNNNTPEYLQAPPNAHQTVLDTHGNYNLSPDLSPRGSQHPERHRRVGRDHGNFIQQNSPTGHSRPPADNGHAVSASMFDDIGPPGMPYPSPGNPDEPEDQGGGLKLVVVDKSDDDYDDNGVGGGGGGGGNGPRHHRSSDEAVELRSGGDVYPIDKHAVDRDMYRQLFVPQGAPPGNNTSDGGNKNPFPNNNSNNNNNGGVYNNMYNNTNGPENHGRSQMEGANLTHQVIPNSTFTSAVAPGYPQHPNVREAFSDNAQNQHHMQQPQQQPHQNLQHHPHQLQQYHHNQQQQQQQHEQYYNPSQPASQHPGGADPLDFNQHHGTSFQGSAVQNYQMGPGGSSYHDKQPLYSMSQIDYDRFTSVPSQLSTIREGGISQLDTFRNDDSGDRIIDSKTFLVPSPALLTPHPLAPEQGSHRGRSDFRINSQPGYKFDVVNGYNPQDKRASRANVLNRAEQLLDARRGHSTERSDSSEENRGIGHRGRIKEVEEEDGGYGEGYIDPRRAVRGTRHQALRHVNRRGFDDSTSYQSSDDVLNTLRFQPRGPVSKAARRARLTSVNARLNKQRRLKAARRYNLPPHGISDDDITSESDIMEPPINFRRQVDDMGRYEESRIRDVTNEQPRPMPPPGESVGSKGRRVYFFRNGDVHFKARQILVNSKLYLNLEKLLVNLSSIVETSTGVKHIFSWPEGREIKSITEFENGKYYVCSSTNKLQRLDYGNSKEGYWKNGKVDRKETYLFQKDGKIQSPLRRPRVLTIISNLYRDSREKLILNTSSAMNFEDILNDIVNMVNIPNPPVRALYTERKPHTRVESYSQLIRDFADHENFLACGEEMVPLEMTSKRPLPGGGPENGGKKGHRRNPRSEYGDSSPTRSSDVTGYQSNDRLKQQSKGRRRKTDSVRVDINQKTREFFPPTMMDEEDDGLKPDKKLRLDWIYGFRGRDVKQNLSVLPSSGELVYFVAAVVVVYDKKFATQKHYLGHSEEISCLTVHPNGRFVATGQISGKTPESGAHVRIWDGLSLSTYAVIGLGVFQQGIACVNFSENTHVPAESREAVSGELIMAIDDSDRHVLTVWEWQTEKMVARTTTTTDPIVSGCFYPFDDTILLTYGKEHVHFWRMFWEKGRKIMRDKLSGNFEDDVPKFVTSVCFSPSGDVITGDSSGAILVWSRDNNSVFAVNDNLSVQTKRAHKKSVSALCMLGDGTLLSGGGNEVKAWDSINNYSLVKERVLPETAGHVRTIVPISAGGLDGSIYVATTRNKVLEGSLQLKFKFVIQGHVEELWAVECHPLEQTFVSAGHDQTVVKWSAVSHAPVWRVNVENPCTSISIDPKGRLIALGTTSGKVLVLNSYNGIQLTTLLAGTAQINALSFSPDGKQLAVGTFDGFIQIYYLQDEGHSFFRSQSSALKHGNMFIMHMDWSIDSKLIQAVMGDYDIIYWDTTTMQKIKAARTLRDVKWATHNCPIGHSIIGPWQNLDRGDVINVVSRSQYRDLMVAGDNRGRLRLYKWPCSLQKAGFRNTKTYSSNVTCASFSCDDSSVITSGGNDAALMQFSVLDPVNTR